MSPGPSVSDEQQLDRHLDTLQKRLPDRYADWLERLRRPRARWIRVPAGLLLVCGGFFGFLPVLGFWMLPLGLLLLAVDVRPLQRPTARALDWIARRWPTSPSRRTPSR